MTGLRSERLLPLIAAERTLRGLLLVAAGIYLLMQSGASLKSTISHLARTVELDPNKPFLRHLIDRIGSLSQHRLTLFGVGAIVYGGLELVEGAGLFRRKRWAEWLTVIATSLLFVPEVWEIAKRPTVLKVGALVVNIAVVWYLIRRLRRRG